MVPDAADVRGKDKPLLGRVMPDYDERKQELAKRGAALWFGGVS